MVICVGFAKTVNAILQDIVDRQVTIPYHKQKNIRESDFSKEIKIIFAETKKYNNAEEKPNTHPTISYIFPINARKR